MTKMSKTIVFFGNEKLATGIPHPKPVILDAIRTAGFTIESIVTGPLNTLKPHNSQLAVLAAYGRIIPQSVLDQFPLGIINVHPSLLPLYRGPTPIEQALLDGTRKTGVSIMQLTAGMDEGPIYKQKAVHLRGNESKVELTERLQRLGAELVVEVLPQIATGQLQPRSQPHPDRAIYSRKLTKEDGILDLTKSAEQLEREIRAYFEWPKSSTQLAGKDVIITAAHVAKEAGSKDLSIQTSKDFLIIDRLKPAGGKEMTSQAFLAGHKHLL